MKEPAAVLPKLLAVLPICFPIAFSGKQHPALNETGANFRAEGESESEKCDSSYE
jgi:hypothetical protein